MYQNWLNIYKSFYVEGKYNLIEFLLGGLRDIDHLSNINNHNYNDCNNLSPFKMAECKIKVYKAMSYSLENCKLINCIVFSIILNYLISIIKLRMGSGYAWKHQQIDNIFYSVLKVNGLTVRWIFIQHTFTLWLPFWKFCKI